MAGQPRKRRTFWIADVVTPVLRDRALLLNQKGYDVQFFTSLDALVHELQSKRAGVLVVSDDGDEAVTERILLTLMSMPEVQGARLVMVRNTHSDRINFLAACANFRDIIPSNIDERLWLTRFVFATAGKPLQYVQPAGQITLNNISAVALPARVTHLGDRLLTIECRARPPVGATLNLAGSLADHAGVPTISLKVVETRRSHLLYRFSDAIVAEWSAPAGVKGRILDALAEVRQSDPGPRCRVFVAVQSAELRSLVLTRFDDPRFEISTALQKQSIVDEPKFFTPDLVFIEAALCLEENGERFDQMVANLHEKAAIIILGRLETFDLLKKKYAGRTLLQLQKLPKHLTQSVLSRFLPQSLDDRGNPVKKQDQAGANIVSEHPFSLAEVTFPARLHRIHPLAAEIAMPFPVSNFALCRIDSPLLRKMIGRNPYVKLTTTYQDTHPDAPPFIHVADCYLADLDQGERRAMVQALTKLVAESLARLDPTGSFGAVLGSGAIGESRTPEFGSLRSQTPLIAAAAAAAPRIAGAYPRPAAASSPLLDAGAAADLHDPEHADERLLPAEQIADLLKPAFKPLAQAAADLKDTAANVSADALQSIRTVATPKPKKRKKKGVATAQVSTRQIVLSVVFICFVVALFWALFAGLAGTMDKSGGTYSDQLFKFSKGAGQ